MRASPVPVVRAASTSRRNEILVRVVAGTVGGWVFVYGFAALGTASLLSAGLTYADARTLVYLLAFLLYTALVCWAFAARRAARAALVLFGGGAAMTALAWWLARPAA